LDWNILASNIHGRSIEKDDKDVVDYDDRVDGNNHVNIDDVNDNDDNNDNYENDENSRNLKNHKNDFENNVFESNNKERNENRKFDLIIGSDLIYCKNDTCGVFNVISRYLSENGIFIIVVPKPSHRYGTEFLKPFLYRHGFKVYSRTISHTTCTSSEVFQNGVRGYEGWKIEESTNENEKIQEDNENDKDDFDYNDKHISAVIDSLIINDDYLVGGLDEHEFISWDLIIGHRSRGP
jgi:hypothetical protein